MELRKKLGFILGPLFFILFFFLPVLPGNPKAHNLLCIFFLVVVWWVTECIPIAITALLIPVFITALEIADVKEAFAPFANPIIMLFLGSFILAKAMSYQGLDRKFAYSILNIKSIAQKKSRILLAFSLATAFLSMWISNTATTAMMFPIVLGLLGGVASESKGKKSSSLSSFGVVLMLTLAYSASIGGICTPIGSPPNLIAIGMLEKLAGTKISFFQWMVLGFLVFIPMIMVLFFIMRRSIPKDPQSTPMKPLLMQTKKEKKGLNRAQKTVLFAFSVTVFLWVFPGIVSLISGKDAPLYLWFHQHIPESTAAVIGAGLLFILPADPSSKGRSILPLKEAMRIDWGTLLLFGGGLSMGFQMFQTGLAEAIGKFFFASGGDSSSYFLISLISISLSVFLTELTSNTASANMIIPIIIAVSGAASADPLPAVLGSAIGCSFAFMLPVATPPNAIVYGSGLIRLPQMMKYGFRLNIAGILIIWIMVTLVAPMLGLV